MKIKNIKLTTLLLFALAFIVSIDAQAAGMGGGGTMGMGPPCGGPFPPCPVPLDNSVVLLLIAGALYGTYKIYHSFKKNPA